jgi:hypothetical protein
MGEFAQAKSMANFLIKKKEDITFLIHPSLENTTKESKFKYFVIENPNDTKKVLDKIDPDVLFLCNSKTSYKMINHRFGKLVLSLDSNWLFSPNQPKKFKFHDWVDYYILVFPKKIFLAGLKKYNGHYSIPEHNLKKIFNPGFIPSLDEITVLEKLEIRKQFIKNPHEKLIFCYFGRGLTIKKYGSKYISKFIEAVDKINSKKIVVRVVCSGDVEVFSKYSVKPWFTFIPWMKEKQFDNVLQSSDLVIQHHGLGTMPKVIGASIPVIPFIPYLDKKIKKFHSPSYEIDAFEKNKVCCPLTNKDKIRKIEKTIRDLLFDKEKIDIMKKNQKKIYIPGEGILLDFIREKLRKDNK